MTLIINPCIPLKKILTENEINKAKQSIEKRMNKYQSKVKEKKKKKKKGKPSVERPPFIDKYFHYSEEEEEENPGINAILKTRKLNHNSDALFLFGREKNRNNRQRTCICSIRCFKNSHYIYCF